LNVAGKKLGDWIDLTSKLAAAESRAERFSSSLDNVRNEAKKNARRAEQWERKFNDDGPRCKVRTDSKEGRFIAPTDCGKEDLEQRLARVKEISRGNCADCSESMLGQLGGFTRIGEYRCYYCKAWFCGDHAFAHFDDHDKGQQRRISELEQRLAMARKIIINQPHARLCNCSFAVAVCNCWKAAALKELEGK
jgi:hypothetical protein